MPSASVHRSREPLGIVSSCHKMDNKKRLAYAIIRFLHDQLRHGGLSSDAQESLEGTCGPLPSLLPAVQTLVSRRYSRHYPSFIEVRFQNVLHHYRMCVTPVIRGRLS